MSIESRLETLGLVLPDAPAAKANYLPLARHGDLLHVSGQVSSDETGLIVGRLDDTIAIEHGVTAARCCALSLLAQVRAACDGDLSRLERVIKLTVFVNAAPDFTDQSTVANGASDLLVEIFGERGRHARSAVGVSSLPFGVAVEIEGIFQIA